MADCCLDVGDHRPRGIQETLRYDCVTSESLYLFPGFSCDGAGLLLGLRLAESLEVDLNLVYILVTLTIMSFRHETIYSH